MFQRHRSGDHDMIRYLFIDGAYLRANFRKCMTRYHGEVIGNDIDASIQATTSILPPVQKVFYYDCIDERQRENEPDDEFDERVKAQEDLFTSIREVAGWHVREGRLVGARKHNRSQKRVDVLLAVEMRHIRASLERSLVQILAPDSCSRCWNRHGIFDLLATHT
jgi:hypothetical protein